MQNHECIRRHSEQKPMQVIQLLGPSVICLSEIGPPSSTGLSSEIKKQCWLISKLILYTSIKYEWECNFFSGWLIKKCLEGFSHFSALDRIMIWYHIRTSSCEQLTSNSDLLELILTIGTRRLTHFVYSMTIPFHVTMDLWKTAISPVH